MAERKLHGFGLPINGIADYSWNIPVGTQQRPRFANAFSDWAGTPLTLRERTMIALMGEITDKPDWTSKIDDESIVQKWRREREEKERSAEPEQALTEQMFDYCLEELRDLAKHQQQFGFVPAIAGDATVFKSDEQISSSLNISLRAAVAPLEAIPDEDKDWHPASDDKVLDLVHPSLFPLLYGRTKILPEGNVPLHQCSKYLGNGVVVPVPSPDELKVEKFSGRTSWHTSGDPRFYSARYQWLPCQVDFAENESTRISSYINNLHPNDHEPLYEVLGKIIARTIPMWDATLTSTEQGQRPPRIDVDDDDDNWIEPEGKRTPGEEEDENEKWELDEELNRANRVLIVPEPGEYSQRANHEASPRQELKPVSLREDFATQGLQVIIKLANIHLTPEKPQYDGGTWHIEGQLNEHICASAIYYYDCQNVTDSHLSFRESTSVDYLSDKPYPQDDYEHLERLYGIKNYGAATQILGQVNTKEGRILTFPNIFQHRVGSFELADKSRPGHRKILALFLVDPYIPIPSTAHVPPQQKTWWRDAVLEHERVAKLPPEVQEMIVDADEYAIDMEEAKRIRLELMEERKLFVDNVEERFQQEIFSFCEH